MTEPERVEPSATLGGTAEIAVHARVSGTVLVVNDESQIRILISEVLIELGYAVELACNGPSALQVLRSVEMVDLLVTDVSMPGGMNGRQLAELVHELTNRTRGSAHHRECGERGHRNRPIPVGHACLDQAVHT